MLVDLKSSEVASYHFLLSHIAKRVAAPIRCRYSRPR